MSSTRSAVALIPLTLFAACSDEGGGGETYDQPLGTASTTMSSTVPSAGSTGTVMPGAGEPIQGAMTTTPTTSATPSNSPGAAEPTTPMASMTSMTGNTVPPVETAPDSIAPGLDNQGGMMGAGAMPALPADGMGAAPGMGPATDMGMGAMPAVPMDGMGGMPGMTDGMGAAPGMLPGMGAGGAGATPGMGMEPEPDPVSYETVYAIFTANCSGMQCHGDNAAFMHPEFAASDMATSEMAATAYADDIVDRINRQPGTMGFMPNMGMQLSEADRATIQAWVESLP